MKLKLDENLSRHLKVELASLGHEVSTAAEEDLLSKPDVSIAAAAQAEGRMLLSLGLHFADIRRFPPGTHPGIVLFHPPRLGPLMVNRFVRDFVAHQDLSALAGTLAIVESDRVRVRRA